MVRTLSQYQETQRLHKTILLKYVLFLVAIIIQNTNTADVHDFSYIFTVVTCMMNPNSTQKATSVLNLFQMNMITSLCSFFSHIPKHSELRKKFA